MTEISAEFESVAAMNPYRVFSIVVMVVNEWSVVDCQIREVRVIYGWGIAGPGEDGEGIRCSARHIGRRVQPNSRRLEVLHCRILRSGMAREVESGVEYKIRRGCIVRIEIQLRGGGCVPAGRGGHAINTVRRIVLVGIIEDAITRQVPFLTDRVIHLEARHA